MQCEIDGTDYEFDPTLKTFVYTAAGADLSTILEYDEEELIDAATDSAVTPTPVVTCPFDDLKN